MRRHLACSAAVTDAVGNVGRQISRSMNISLGTVGDRRTLRPAYFCRTLFDKPMTGVFPMTGVLFATHFSDESTTGIFPMTGILLPHTFRWVNDRRTCHIKFSKLNRIYNNIIPDQDHDCITLGRVWGSGWPAWTLQDKNCSDLSLDLLKLNLKCTLL